MPLNRPALTLEPGPLGVQQARRWVMQVCTDIGRPELAECARLGVSELVTNAVLHGQEPIAVRVRGTHEHPRVEVRDASRDAPQLPHPEHDGALLTFGRGLGIVARAAVAWGAEVESDGKVVWFVPDTDLHDNFTQGVITGVDDTFQRRPSAAGDLEVTVLGVPSDLYRDFLQHNRELRREVRLLALAHESDYPLAKALSEAFDVIEQDMRAGIDGLTLEDAVGVGAPTADVLVSLPPATLERVGAFIALLDAADEFCRDERLLSLARSPEQQRFQRWILGEFVRQGAGAEPMAWQDLPADVDQAP